MAKKKGISFPSIALRLFRIREEAPKKVLETIENCSDF